MHFKIGLLTLLIVSAFSAQAEIPPEASCGTKFSGGAWIDCGSEQTAPDNRPRPTVVQPKADSVVMGSCAIALPANQSYGAQLEGVSCGTLSTQKNFLRLPIEMSPEVRDEWKMASYRRDQNRMQKAAKREEKFTSEVEIPMSESWTWQEKLGDFDSRFGTETYTTECSVRRVKHTPHIEEQIDYNVCVRRSDDCSETATDYNNCLRYEEEYTPPPPPPPSYGGGSRNDPEDRRPSPQPSRPSPPPPTTYGGGSGYGGGGGSRPSTPAPQPQRPSSGGYQAPRRSDSGAGESARSSQRSYDRSSSSRPSSGGGGGSRSGGSGRRSGRRVIKYNTQQLQQVDQDDQNHQVEQIDDQSSLLHLVGDRNPARSCAQYGRKCVAYRCAAYGTKPVTVWTTQDLGVYKYSCTKTRPLWGEWLVTRRQSRSCRPQPVAVSVEFKTSPDWKPGYINKEQPHRSYHDSLPNQWDLLPGESEKISMIANQGSGSRITPSVSICSRLNKRTGVCEEGGWNDYQVKPTTITCQYAPKLNVIIPIETLGRNVRKAPNPLKVTTDGDKGTSLTFGENQSRPSAVLLEDTSRTSMMDAAENSRTFGTNDEKDSKGASASGGYWLETRFKMRLLRIFPGGTQERTTIPNTFGSNQGDIFDKTMTISLEGKDGLDRLYRPGGPAEFIFGGVYKHFGVELTPGANYVLKVSLVQRGLPWYITGCHDGKKLCEGEDGTNDSYSEEVDIPFTANPKVDNRSWFTIWEDFQKRFRMK